MNERDFTPADRAKLRAILDHHGVDGAPLNVALEPPTGGQLCGHVGTFTVYLVKRVVWLVAMLTFPNNVQQALDDGVMYTEVALNTLDHIMPEPGPRRDPEQYPNETALASNTAHPDHMSIIRLSTVQSTTPT